MTSSSSNVLQQYQTIADITTRMVDQARNNEWDTVIELSQLYIQAVEHLKNINTLSDAERADRRHLLTRILKDDAQIRQLATPELRRLGHLLGNMNRQKNVVQAYCAPSLNA